MTGRIRLLCYEGSSRKGAIGFDGENKLVAAYRGALVHVKTSAQSDCER